MTTSWLRKLCGIPLPPAGHKRVRLLARLDVEEFEARIVPQATMTWVSGIGDDANPCITNGTANGNKDNGFEVVGGSHTALLNLAASSNGGLDNVWRNAGNDLISSNYTACDASPMPLDAVMREWTRTRLDVPNAQESYKAHIDHLMSGNQAALAESHTKAFVSHDNAEEVTLTLTVDLAADTRTWTATGAIEDSGTAATVWIQFGALNSPVVAVVQIDTLFTNADGTGTFTIRRTVIETADGPNRLAREGTWHVVDATGVYAGLKGHGTLSGTEVIAVLILDTLTGSLTIAG
jgi:hypothetical protein